jgi:hypothetical protein
MGFTNKHTLAILSSVCHVVLHHWLNTRCSAINQLDVLGVSGVIIYKLNHRRHTVIKPPPAIRRVDTSDSGS